VYVLGFGLDFAELDLWWLIGRRLSKNEKRGSIYFYEPLTEKNKIKHIALRDMEVIVKDLGMFSDGGKNNYDEFYKKAIEDINKNMQKKIKK